MERLYTKGVGYLSLVLCQRCDLGSCATGSASGLLSLSRIQSTGRGNGTLLFSRDKTLALRAWRVTLG